MKRGRKRNIREFTSAEDAENVADEVRGRRTAAGTKRTYGSKVCKIFASQFVLELINSSNICRFQF